MYNGSSKANAITHRPAMTPDSSEQSLAALQMGSASSPSHSRDRVQVRLGDQLARCHARLVVRDQMNHTSKSYSNLGAIGSKGQRREMSTDDGMAKLPRAAIVGEQSALVVRSKFSVALRNLQVDKRNASPSGIEF